MKGIGLLPLNLCYFITIIRLAACLPCPAIPVLLCAVWNRTAACAAVCCGGSMTGIAREGAMKRRDLLQGGAAALMLSPALAAAQGLPVLRECSVQQQGGLLRLRLELLGAQVAYRSFRLADPERLVIDLSGVSSQAPRIDPIPAGAAVTRIRSAAHLDGLRVVFDLQQPCSVNLRWEDSALVLELAPSPAAWRWPRAMLLQRQRQPQLQPQQSRPARACSPMWSPSTPAMAVRIRVRSVPMRVTKKTCGHGGGRAATSALGGRCALPAHHDPQR